MTTTYANKQWILAGATALIAFLLGFVPQSLNNSEMKAAVQERDQRIERLQREATLSRMHDLASLLYLETTRRNYGIASGHASALFNLVRNTMNEPSASAIKNALETILARRDEIIARLAKPDATVEQDLRALLDNVFQLRIQ